MTSDPAPSQDLRDLRHLRQLFVWVWLPGALDPVVAGVLTATGARYDGEDVLSFTYAASFRDRSDAVSLFTPELPLLPGTFNPTVPGGPVTGLVNLRANSTLTVGGLPPHARVPLHMHSCLRDAAPDAWGRRVLNARLASDAAVDLSELTYLAASSSDRIGALDFQQSPTEYVSRGDGATLEQMVQVAELVEGGQELPEDLAAAAGHGTSIGGARPKALLRDGDRRLIAKFPSTTDTRPAVKAEAVAMLLAQQVGIRVAPVEVRDVTGRSVLLVERFDRPRDGGRRQMLSALTILGYGAMDSRHASYAELAESVRTGPWAGPGKTLRELFTRLVFNVCVGNNDDHLRNHAAFWNGQHLELTPAYDLAPSPRSGETSSQAIAITADGGRASQLRLCRAVAAHFLLSPRAAGEIIDHVVTTIHQGWTDACDQATLTKAERVSLWEREFLNPYIFYDQG